MDSVDFYNIYLLDVYRNYLMGGFVYKFVKKVVRVFVVVLRFRF